MAVQEGYDSFLKTVAEILEEAGKAAATERGMMDVILEHAFAEGPLSLPDQTEEGKWPVMKASERPLTDHEKQWLKALLEDPRIKLFLSGNEDKKILEKLQGLMKDVPPLFEEVPADASRFKAPDDYSDEGYQSYFSRALQALRENRLFAVRYSGGRRTSRKGLFFPYGIEYSPEEDKFCIKCMSLKGTEYTIDVSRIRDCAAGRKAEPEEMVFPEAEIQPDVPGEADSVKKLVVEPEAGEPAEAAAAEAAAEPAAEAPAEAAEPEVPAEEAAEAEAPAEPAEAAAEPAEAAEPEEAPAKPAKAARGSGKSKSKKK